MWVMVLLRDLSPPQATPVAIRGKFHHPAVPLSIDTTLQVDTLLLVGLFLAKVILLFYQQ